MTHHEDFSVVFASVTSGQTQIHFSKIPTLAKRSAFCLSWSSEALLVPLCVRRNPAQLVELVGQSVRHNLNVCFNTQTFPKVFSYYDGLER